MLTYDDRQLQRLFAQLDPRKRKELFRAAFRKTAAKVKKVAQGNVRSSGLRDAQKLSKGVRTVIFKRDAGFRVTVAGKAATMRNPKRERSMHLTRRGKKVPVLQWAEPGTAERYTRTNIRYRRKLDKRGRWRKKKVWDRHLNRGQMPRYGFMAKTKAQVEGSVGADLQQELTATVERICKKYGIK